jgi:UDP:flavonoid glycosyltransferase YjiC (YdhE family)
MRIVFAAIGQAGHAFPLVPLAKELRDAGHEVTYATSAEMGRTIASAGLDIAVSGRELGSAFAEAIGRYPRTEGQSEHEFGMRAGGTVFGDILPRAFAKDLQPWIERHQPDLVIAEMMCPGASIAAIMADVPCVVHSFGRRLEVDSPLNIAISTSFAGTLSDFGLPAMDRADLLGHAYLDICPPSLRTQVLGAPARNIHMRPTAWSPAVRTGPLRPNSGRPWVYLTLGTHFGNAATLRTVAEGLARLDVDILLAAGTVSTSELTDLPDSVRVEAFVPQADLLNEFSLVVSHGGSGTMMGAAQHGIPQLLLPQGADQFDNAAAISSFGAGQTLLAAEVSAAAVENAAKTLLTDGANRDAARDLAKEIASMPTAKAIASEVNSWACPELS